MDRRGISGPDPRHTGEDVKFSEIVKQASVLLKDKGQVSYRMFKREFDLDDETLEDLKAELIEVDGLAVDQDGKMLVWIGQGINGEKDKRVNGNTEGERGKGRKGKSPWPVDASASGRTYSRDDSHRR